MTAAPEQSVDEEYTAAGGLTPADDVVRVYRSDWEVRVEGQTANRELASVWLRTRDDRWVREDDLELAADAPAGARGLQQHTFADLIAAQRFLRAADVHADSDFAGLQEDELQATFEATEQTLADALDDTSGQVESSGDDEPRWRGGSTSGHPPGTPTSVGCPWVPANNAVLGGPTHRLEDIDEAVRVLQAAIERSRQDLAAIRAYADVRRVQRWHADLDALAARADSAVH